MSKMSKGTLWIHVILGSRKWCRLVSVGVGVGALGFAPRQAEVPNCNAEEPQWICIQKVQRLLESETRKHHALNTVERWYNWYNWYNMLITS